MKQGTVDVSDSVKKVKGFLQTKKGMRLVVTVGMAAILLLFLSNLLDTGAKKNAKTAQTPEKTAEEYTADMEKRVADIVSSIAGAGRSKILITLENGAQNVYANENKNTTEQTEDIDEQAGRSETRTRKDTENKLVMADGDNGREPVLETRIEPRIKGVVIVCEGGDDELVKQRLTAAVTTALDIPLKRVCVTKLT